VIAFPAMLLARPHRWFLAASIACASVAAAGPDDGTWRSLAPPPQQSGGRAVLDAVHGRVLLFGGWPEYRPDVYELPLSGPRVWKRLVVQGTPAPSGQYMSIIDDPIRDRLIVFGGSSGSSAVWELSLSGTPTWNPLSPAGTGPGARQQHTAIYDPVRDRMVVFGGTAGSSVYGDVWSLSLSGPPAWQQLAPTGTITARYGHSAVYDPVGDRMIVFGGTTNGSSYLADLHALSLGATPVWSTLTPVTGSPSTRMGHAAVWDPVRQQMVISGGNNSLYASVWALSLTPSVTWTELAPIPTGYMAFSLIDHFAVYDPVQDGMLVGDGHDRYSQRSLDLELSLSSPTAWVAQPYGPSGGDAPGFALDAAHARALLFEGFGTWQVSLGDEPVWTPMLLGGTKPPLRRMSTFVDPVRNRMVVISGSTVWALDLTSPTAWDTLITAGVPPTWAGGQSVAYDPVRDRVLVWDGRAATGIWQLSLAGTPTWSPLDVAGTPPPDRSLPAMLYESVNDRLIVFGGDTANDAWEIPLASSPTWSAITPSGTPPAALGSGTCVLDGLRHRLVVFGMGNGQFWALSLQGSPTWTSLTPQGTSHPFSSAIYMGAIFDATHDRIVTYGGLSGADVPDAFELAFSGILDAPRPASTPSRLAFSRIAPDPATGEQRFEWSRPAGAGATLSIYDVTGQRVWTRSLAAGDTRAAWNGIGAKGRAVSPGVYFARLTLGGDVAQRRIVRLW